MNLDTPTENLPLTSSITVSRLKSVGINTYFDLLNYFPFRYEDYSIISSISKIQIGEVVTIKGTVLKSQNVYTRKGLTLQKVEIEDKTGKIKVVWFNQPYLIRILQRGLFIALAVEAKGYLHSATLEPKEFEILKDLDCETIHTGRLVPIYSEKNGLSTKLIREKIFYLINDFYADRTKSRSEAFFPPEIASYNNLIDRFDAYKNIHFPSDFLLAKKARQRLAFEELFVIQLSARLVRNEWDKEHVTNAFKIKEHQQEIGEFIHNLPFELTVAQKRVINEIIADLRKVRPMNRFLEGDVGSGKTVVAAIACYLAYLNGLQSLFMAPTEILAFQHYQTIMQLFKDYPVKIALHTSSKKQLTNSARSSKDGKARTTNFDIVIGTHALIVQKLNFERVGFAVIDEQHRFGVAQRAKLKGKGINPHLLTMTATPIPRTVALTLYGELDLSVIDEMPIGRLPIKTFLVPKEKRESGYTWIKKQIKINGDQVFIICPLIEESEIETMKSVKAAAKEFERLKNEVFPEFKLGLLHGKLKSKEKDIIMQHFKDKKVDILVSTSVVEVGIDISNATIMIIEASERFGLAQLHQLRGRVGRGDKQSYCLLYTESSDGKVIERLKFFSKKQSGVEIAEYDFKRRGPGEIFGTRQHGYINLKIASMSDFELIDKSKKAVKYFLNKYQVDEFPEIKKGVEEYKTKQISRD